MNKKEKSAPMLPGAQFTKYVTIYRKFIVRLIYDSDIKIAKISLGLS